jgi:aryl-alcohol dehydrogenase-like predicted oxidoreductase
MADKKGCSPGQLAIAWVIAQGAIPIPGTRNPERLKENVGGKDVELSEGDLKELRQLIEDAAPKGDR